MISLKEYLQASDKDKKKMEDYVKKQIERESSSKHMEEKLLSSKEFKSLVKKYQDITYKEYVMNSSAKLIFHVDVHLFEGRLVLTDSEFNRSVDTFDIVEKSKSFKDLKLKVSELHKQSQALIKKYNIEKDDFFDLLENKIVESQYK